MSRKGGSATQKTPHLKTQPQPSEFGSSTDCSDQLTSEHEKNAIKH